MRLDSEVISREHRFTKGLGTAHLLAAQEIKNPLHHFDHLAFSATNFRRAAADALLLNDFDSAQNLFIQAGKVYSTMRMPYAFCMLELAGATEIAHHFWNSIVEQEQASKEKYQTHINKQHVYTLLFYAAEISKRKNPGSLGNLPERIRNELESARPVPLGVLGLPVGAYLNLSTALLESETSIEEALLPFVTAYNSAILQASASLHHWRQMSLPLHPAEPDLLAVLVLTHVALQQRRRSVIKILRQMPLSWQAVTVIKEFLRMRFREEESERHI